MNPNALVVVAIIGGFFAATFTARYNAVIVNSLLLLILIGVVLSNADQWLPYLTGLSAAKVPGKATQTTTIPPASRVGGVGIN